jgi:hypothetical protein
MNKFSAKEKAMLMKSSSKSPAAVWVYSTVKVINVPAVTDSNGQLVCATSSVLGYHVPTQYISMYSGINSNAEAYFGGYDIGIPASAARNITAPSYSGITISFPTPYIYEPTRGATGKTGYYTHGCWYSALKEDYGYVPSSVIKHITDNPAISSQYPGIASCLPGGPSILYVSTCGVAAPEINFPATDLTEHTIVTVSGNDRLHPPPGPVNGPVTTTALPAPAPVNVPVKQSQVIPFTPTQTPPAGTEVAPPQGTAGNAVAATDTIIPLGPQPLAAQTSFAAVIPGQSSLVVSGPITVPVNPAIPLPGSTTTISGTPFVVILSPTTILLPPTTVPAVPPASESTTSISGTAFVVIPSPTTIPLPPTAVPAIPLPSGSTTSIAGTPAVIISDVQTIPVNSAFSVSGSTTVVGGSAAVVSGTPTVVGGTTQVVVSGTQTVALPTTAQGTGGTSKPVQVTGATTRPHNSQAWLCVFFVTAIWVLIV